MKLFSVIRAFFNEPDSPATVGYGRVMVFGLLISMTVYMALSLGPATAKRFKGAVDALDVQPDRSLSSDATDRRGF